MIACPVKSKRKSIDICNAFVQGAPKGALGFVFYGVNESNIHEWAVAMKTGQPWFFVDNSYFDCVRGQQYRVTRNAVQVWAKHLTSDGKRFEALGLEIKPWKPFGPRWLAVEQSPSFMRCVAHNPDWLERHPPPSTATMKVRPWIADKRKQQATLPADLAWADHLLTHSSAAAVEAALAGVAPSVSQMSALAGMICSRDDPNVDERRRYLSVLADNQFSMTEIREGKAWAWLAKN